MATPSIAHSEGDLLRLLGTEEGIKTLLQGGSELGLKVTASTWSNIVDFGVFSREVLQCDIPLGYEDGGEGGERFLTQEIRVSLEGVMGVGSLTLQEYRTLPNKREDVDFQLKLQTAEGDDAIGETVVSVDGAGAGEPLVLQARLVINPNFTAGHINEFILLSFVGQTRHSPVCMSYAECTVGLRIQGTMMAPNEVVLSQRLSAEAKPFTPKVALHYFDYPCPTYVVEQTYATDYVYTAPQGYKSVFFPNTQKMNYSLSFSEDYLSLSPIEFVQKYLNDTPSSKEYDAFDPRCHLKYLHNQEILNSMECVQMDKDIKFYDMRYVQLKFRVLKSGDRSFSSCMKCSFVVKGSSENRPLINVGDKIRFRPAAEDLIGLNSAIGMYELVATVTAFTLKDERVTCVLAVPNFGVGVPVMKFISSVRYHVRFTFDRCGFMFIQKTLDTLVMSTSLQQIVFPPKGLVLSNPLPLLLNCSTPIPIDSDLNLEQREAVETVAALYLMGKANGKKKEIVPAPPYIIFGPPGTGKTKTLISVIRGLISAGSDGNQPRVLACAPSDAAADVLCKRLAKFFTPDEMFRLNWWQRPIAAVPLNLLSYCHISDDARFDIPLRKMRNFKIIVCTSVAAGIMDAQQANLTQFSPLSMEFDLVVLDEISQATECESLVPLSLVKPSGVVVLSGDPEQLGPVPRSPLFRASGMHLSLQERLLQNSIYENVRPHFHRHNSEESDCIPTKTDNLFKFGVYLRHNYRSQKSIFDSSSKLFYQDSLIESGVVDDLDSLSNWRELSGASFESPTSSPGNSTVTASKECRIARRPFLVLFRSLTSGTHQHDLDSPSFYNISEISCIVELCVSLLQSNDVLVVPQDIGIIGAFRAQVLRLRLALRAANLGGINIGSVEDFQGQESKVIIVSTVLTSRVRQLEINERLGLCGDHRKFNVAITRGKSLCIVVGNPLYLYGDPNWRHLMNYCDTNGTFTGDPCALLASVQREEQEEDDILRAAASVALLDMGTSGIQNSNAYCNPYYGSELEWRGLL